MNDERLRLLSEVLDEIERTGGKFNIDMWVEPRFDAEKVPLLPSCETSACALGWAAADPRFMAMGLRLIRMPPLGNKSTRTWVPAYRGWLGYEAAAAFFDLPAAEAEWLFSPMKYTEPPRITDVRLRIHALLIAGGLNGP